MADTQSAEDRVHPVDQKLPPLQMLLVGLQHVLVMYGGAVAVPLIVGAAADLPREDVAFLINADLLVAGIATVVQSLGLGALGIRMPVMMAASFAAVASMTTMAGNPSIGLTGIFGATIAAGAFGLVIAPFVSRLIRFFPPLVTGTAITSIGITLLPVAVMWAGGGAEAENFGAPSYIGVAMLVLAIILLINRFMRGFWVNISVLVGMATGFVIAWPLGMVDLAGMDARPLVQIVDPLHYGWPTFQAGAVISMCVVMMITFVESTGMFLALGRITERDVDGGALKRGLLLDAAATFFAGFFNTFLHTSFSQNIGLVGMTGVRSRFVTALGGAILITLSLLPKAAFVVASIPPAVLGGAGFAMFGMVTAAGISILHEADMGNRHNQLLVAVSLGFGMIPVARPDFFHAFPEWLAPIVHSGIVLATISALVLNALFNRADTPAEIAADPDDGVREIAEGYEQ